MKMEMKNINGHQFIENHTIIIGYGVLGNIYVLEFVGTSWRTIVGCFPFWGISTILLGGFYYLVPYWRNMYLISGLLGVPFIILMM